MVTILNCKTKAELKLFERTPEAIHSNEPYFVPPFPGSIVKFFSPKSPAQKHGKLFPMLAYREGKVVGRIAAVVNRNHNEYYKDKVGFFGFFDFIDDVEVARALYEKAKEVIRAEGLSEIRGPYSPTVNDECGLLVEGFESIPFVSMPFNPAYYEKIYLQLGLTKARDLYAYYLSSAGGTPEKVLRVLDRVKKKSGITLRSIEMKRLDEELKVIQELYNDTLKRNWGFVPISYEDLQYAADDLKQVVDPEMVMVAEKDGVPIGFCMFIPNVNEFMWKAKKHKNTLARILKFAWLMKTSKPKEIRLAVLGMKPEYQNTGIAALFYSESFVRGQHKWVGGELSWIEESNEPMMKSIGIFGAKRYKNYRIFEQALD
mgnify:CR=1 FL=1